LGWGVAEASGLVNALIRKLVVVAPPWALTYILVAVGILSSLAADAGYLVLIPLAAAAFISVGRHPLAGLTGAFAAVAGVFLVNVFIVPVDGILTGITNDAIHIVDPNKNISLTANLWFAAASVVVMGIIVALITDRFIEPRLGRYEGDHPVESAEMSAEETRGLRFSFWGLIGVLAFLGLMRQGGKR
jgi:aminobenzoyl-glutamate transport protein